MTTRTTYDQMVAMMEKAAEAASDRTQSSIAISLKRIADALERIEAKLSAPTQYAVQQPSYLTCTCGSVHGCPVHGPFSVSGHTGISPT